jgi:hypothetical protein
LIVVLGVLTALSLRAEARRVDSRA